MVLRHRLVIITLILLVAVFTRLWKLGEAPPGLQHDELFKAQEGQSIVTDGNFRVFYETNQGHEGGYVWLLAVSYVLFGNSLLMVKMPAFWCGLLTVALLYRVVREIYGFRPAVFASGLAAVSFWALFTSRVGLRAVLLPPVILLVIWGLWRICYARYARWKLSVFTGLVLGFAIYTYTASIALYAAYAGFLITLALFDRPTFQKRWRELLLITVLGAVLTLPMIYHRLNNPMGQN
ncbi:MAG: glycosyltransferase family 39 protein, partial [Anaerolineae bacterium]|nr:glycosyltransferase family 39 protein [Anaerolineae bacterium]